MKEHPMPNFPYFLQYDCWLETSTQEAMNVNEARGISRMSPDPLRWGLGTVRD